MDVKKGFSIHSPRLPRNNGHRVKERDAGKWGGVGWGAEKKGVKDRKDGRFSRRAIPNSAASYINIRSPNEPNNPPTTYSYPKIIPRPFCPPPAHRVVQWRKNLYRIYDKRALEMHEKASGRPKRKSRRGFCMEKGCVATPPCALHPSQSRKKQFCPKRGIAPVYILILLRVLLLQIKLLMG